MRTHTQAFLDPRATATTVLTGEVGSDCDDRDVMYRSIDLHPVQEDAPTCVVNTLREVFIFHQIGYLKVFKGNQVARRDQRVRLFAGEIFTLPLHLQGAFCQLPLCLFAVGRCLLFAGVSSVKTLQLLLRFAIEAGIGNGVAVRVGGVGFQTDINTDVLPCGSMLDLTDGIRARTGNSSHRLDVPDGRV